MAFAITGWWRQWRIFQQRVNAQGSNRQNGDFAQGIKAPEVHQNDVDHVGAATARFAVLKEEIGNRTERLRQHGQGNQSHTNTGNTRDGDIPEATFQRGFHGCPARHVVECQHEQNNGHHFHRQLGHGQVGRREAGKSQCHDQSHHAQYNQRVKSLPVHGCRQQGANDQHACGNGRGPVHRAQPGLANEDAQIQQRHGSNRQHADHKQHGVSLQRAVLDSCRKAVRQVDNPQYDRFEYGLLVDFLEACVEIKELLALAIHDQTAKESRKTHDQWQVKAMDNRQLIIRHLAAKGGVGGSV